MKVGELFRAKYDDYPVDSLSVVWLDLDTNKWEYSYNNSFTSGLYVPVKNGSVIMLIAIFDKHLETGIFLLEDQFVELDFASVEPV